MLATWDAVSTLDRLFDDVMGSTLGTATNSRTFEPAVDVRAGENELIFVCDVPGVKADALEVTLENRVLTIKGARTFDGRAEERVMLGRAYGSFHRAWALPDVADDEHLAAELVDGVLTVRIPKRPSAKPRKIPIRAGEATKQLEEQR